jgi:hypothetical protein
MKRESGIKNRNGYRDIKYARFFMNERSEGIQPHFNVTVGNFFGANNRQREEQWNFPQRPGERLGSKETTRRKLLMQM